MLELHQQSKIEAVFTFTQVREEARHNGSRSQKEMKESMTVVATKTGMAGRRSFSNVVFIMPASIVEHTSARR
jgi:hypothetical protein